MARLNTIYPTRGIPKSLFKVALGTYAFKVAF